MELEESIMRDLSNGCVSPSTSVTDIFTQGIMICRPCAEHSLKIASVILRRLLALT